IKIARERADDLKQQLESASLTQAQFDEQYAELELTLGDDLDIAQNEPKNASQGRWVAPVILIFVPLFSVLIYLTLGEPDALKKAEIKQTQQAGNETQDINAAIAGLAQRLQQNPDNAQDWIMLGRSFKYVKQYRLAANSFEKAYALLGDQPEIMLQYADSLAMANGGKLAGKSTELIFKALDKDPDNVTGLWLGGMAKAEIGDFSQAILYFRKLETILPPGSDSYKQVQKLISTVQAQNGGAKKVENTVATKNVESKVSIDVQVSLKGELKTRVNSGDTVFVYAKAVTGPPMPLAIVRKQVSDLPLSVTLNDAMAMMPAMKLSNFKQVKVMARISKSGTAMQQKGDFI
ncbi:MAG: c-type cytochrome biogenesis protein CcmI, partial [Methylococcales bacterium]|nr:c-type cytochrome biogenesis protein CcmI [Methylococcales bacterium]